MDAALECFSSHVCPYVALTPKQLRDIAHKLPQYQAMVKSFSVHAALAYKCNEDLNKKATILEQVFNRLKFAMR